VIDIKCNGKVIGHLNPDELTVGDQIDLEAAVGAKQIAEWLIAHAGSKMEDIRPIPFPKLKELMEGLAEALKVASELPN